jgi:hypothetical protein
MKMIRLAAVLLFTAGIVHAQQNTFVIQSNGTAAGKCVYTFDKAKDGFKVSSRFQAKIAAQFHSGSDPTNPVTNDVTDIQQSHAYKLDASYTYLGGSVMDNTTQQTRGYSPNKQRTVMQISMVQAGIQGQSSELPLMPGYMVLPPDDASAVQALLYLATSHPTSDSLYFIIVPNSNPRSGPSSVQAKWVPQPSVTGTLAGKPVTLHHFSFAFGKSIYDVYADDTNTLMETDISVLKVSYVRTGFALDAKK